MPNSEFHDKFMVGNIIHLRGYTSSSLNQDVALKFCVDEETAVLDNTDLRSIVMVIKFKGGI